VKTGTTVAQLHQARQKSGQRHAATGRCDQQRRAAVARLGQKFELMGARNPTAAGEPAREWLGQKRCSFENSHPPELAG
jgi:hypothetical protein